jgi:hypothetical protein
MNKNIQFLRDFLSYDRWRIAQLRETLYSAMERLGEFLQQREPSVTILYKDEDDPAYELAQLLDGNNFIIETMPDRFCMHSLKLVPIYSEIIEVECTYEVQEIPIPVQTTYNEYYNLSAYACKCELASIRNESRRRLRAYHTLITIERYDEVDQPP